MHAIANPVVSGIIPDSIMRRVNANNLIEFISPILSNPIGIKYSQSPAFTSHPLFGHAPQTPLELQLIHTLRSWLPVHNSLWHGSLSSASSHSHSEHAYPLFCLVAEAARFIRTGWPRDTMQHWKLPVFPRTYTKDEVHYVRLLLFPKLLQVFVSTHYYWFFSKSKFILIITLLFTTYIDFYSI